MRNLVLLLAAMMGWPVFAEEEAAPSGKAITLVAVGDVEPALAERVRAFAQENLALPVRLLGPRPAGPAASLHEIGQSALAAKTGADACFVVLAWPLEDLPSNGIRMPDDAATVVNVRALKPADGDPEIFGRRVEREVMMGIGLLLGMEPCPNPQCAMWMYANNDELDLKGRNYCPPCLDRAQAIAVSKDISIVAESSFAPNAGIAEEPGEPEPIAETP